MNRLKAAVTWVDAWQQRHRVPGFLFAVNQKFGDDRGGNLVALLTYFAFLATFPLLLALTGVLSLVLHGHPDWQRRISSSALSEFPIIGNQIHSQLGVATLGNSTLALVIGILGAAWGGRGLANAVQNTLNTVWRVRMVDRPGFPWNLLRTLGLLGLLGLGVILTALTTAVSGGASHILGIEGVPANVLTFALSTVLDIGLFVTAYRLATAKTVATRDLVPGAVISAVVWQILLSVAGIVINHYLRNAQALAGLFGVVLGLLAWFGLQATVMVYAIEIDVVRVRRLWPRAIAKPPLTAADKRSMAAETASTVRRPEQRITTVFAENGGTADGDRQDADGEKSGRSEGEARSDGHGDGRGHDAEASPPGGGARRA